MPNTSFIDSKITWDSSWPADKRAYYNARKAVQENGEAKRAAHAVKSATKREPSEAQKIAALKKQLKDLK